MFIYLASKSPRRRELLQQMGVDYKVLSVDVEEQRQEGEVPTHYVSRLSIDKALAGSCVARGAPVLGADTIVVLGDEVLEKPSSKAHAKQMLSMLSGRSHQVMTAVTVIYEGRVETLVSTSTVTFRHISESEGERYYLSGEPVDKAGGYAIQGLGAVFIKEITGSYSGVMGLPIYETQQLLEIFDIRVL